MRDEYVMDTSGGFSEFDPSEGFMGGFTEPVMQFARRSPILATIGVIVVLALLVLFVCWVSGVISKKDNFDVYGQAARFQTIPSDNVSGDTHLDKDAVEWQQLYYNGGVEGMIPGREDAFIGNRETPYFSDVTNRVLRLENREKEAIRALAKINQERLRRQAERPDATVPWDSHWADWKRANPLGEEQLI